jgi:hypothetical protein
MMKFFFVKLLPVPFCLFSIGFKYRPQNPYWNVRFIFSEEFWGLHNIKYNFNIGGLLFSRM